MQAELSLSILGSSIALLSGQKPSFRFLVRVVQTSTGQRAKQFGHGVSDAFVVSIPFHLDYYMFSQFTGPNLSSTSQACHIESREPKLGDERTTRVNDSNGWKALADTNWLPA
jgi:hypothetical protein